jgi:glycosyltransferase involved in cell wall biosynthesis
MSVRLAILASHPIQHFAPWHRELAKLGDIDLKVIFYSRMGTSEAYFDPHFQTNVKWDVPLLDGYDCEFLPSSRNVQKLGFWEVDNPDVVEALDRFNPDVVKVFGYASRSNWRVASWARQHRKPLLIYSDTNIGKPVKWWKRGIRRVAVSSFYRQVDGALCVGDSNKEVHRTYGIPEERLFPGALPIDRKRLLDSVPDRAAAAKEIRGRLGIPEDAFVLIFCGKYRAIKSPVDLIAAAHEAFKCGLPVWALMVGEGEERSAMEEFCRTQAVKNAILTGFVNQSEVPKYFAASDAVAVTSWRDNHPLVVAEGGSFGLPLIASDHIGCIGETDTARPGVNAIVYPWGDRERLRAAIELLAKDTCTYRKMSAAAIKISETQDVTVAARQLADAAIRLHEMGPR